MCPPYPQRDRKRQLIGAVCRNHRIKRLVPCRCLDGHVKEPYEMSMAWEPDRRSNFFSSPHAHLCTVTYMTEISLIVTLNNLFTHLNLRCPPIIHYFRLIQTTYIRPYYLSGAKIIFFVILKVISTFLSNFNCFCTIKNVTSKNGLFKMKSPTKCQWRWEPDSWFNFFNPPAHLCAVTYITEISLHVTL